jgi:hypothetical protein
MGREGWDMKEVRDQKTSVTNNSSTDVVVTAKEIKAFPG